MGKYFEELQKQVDKGGGDKEISNQQLMNVVSEFLQESIDMCKKVIKEIDEVVKDEPKQSLLRQIWEKIKSL